jgi:phosphoribosylformylglycinamidine cyclo-ligase
VADAYREAGVDIDAGDALVERIKPIVKRTMRPEVLSGVGGFGALVGLGGRYRDPILVSGTDGVGTKLLVAQAMGQHTTIGIDLVAMCVNDIAVVGAEPLFFLDYFATGKLHPHEAASVVEGIAEGCVRAGCALVGGETAEMPGMYAPGHYDLAGFAVGVVERARLCDGARIQPGDALIGLPSSGVHSNGFSLVRHVMSGAGLDAASMVPELDRPLGAVLLEPTRIYVKELLALHAADLMLGAAHITGGGLPGNVPRMFPDGVHARISRSSWVEPPIFAALRRLGGIDDASMLRTFNLGLGMVIAVRPDRVADAVALVGGSQVGTVEAGDGEVVFE